MDKNHELIIRVRSDEAMRELGRFLGKFFESSEHFCDEFESNIKLESDSDHSCRIQMLALINGRKEYGATRSSVVRHRLFKHVSRRGEILDSLIAERLVRPEQPSNATDRRKDTQILIGANYHEIYKRNNPGD